MQPGHLQITTKDPWLSDLASRQVWLLKNGTTLSQIKESPRNISQATIKQYL